MEKRAKQICLFIAAVLFFPVFSLSAVSFISIDLSRFWNTVETASGRSLHAQKEEMVAILAQKDQLNEQQKLEMVNQYFEKWVTYQTDDVVWQETDYWATPAEMLTKAQGDCEDYAIAKYVFLQELGIPSSQLRMIYVKAKIGGRRSTLTQAHMVLGYYANPTSEPLILDSLISEVLPAGQRTDLTPVFSFNSEGIWSPGGAQSVGSPTARLSRWRNLLQKLTAEGIALGQA